MNFTLSEQTSDELKALLSRQGPPVYRPQISPQSQQIALVKCTSSVIGMFGGSGSSGSGAGGSSTQNYYTGLVKLWQSDDGIGYGYVEDTLNATCYMMEANNGTLTNGVIYLCQRSGNFMGQPVFIACNGGTLTTVRIMTNFCPSGSGSGG